VRTRKTDPDEVQLQRVRTALARRYAVERIVGQGGMATVYLAKDLRHRRKVAVKVLDAGLSSALRGDRFLQEIEFAARLHHPHILPLYDSGKAGPFLFYVMPYVSGESLRARLYRSGPLPVQEALRVVRDVADALGCAHDAEVIHRDIKPDNVMLSGRHALVMDFGVAKALSQAGSRKELTTHGITVGTPRYMAPEQAAGDPSIDHRADIYALGIVAYELIAGRPPIEAETPQATLAAQVTEIPRPLERVVPDVPQAVADIVMRCLEKAPADRWQSAEELLAQLEAHVAPSGVSAATQALQGAMRRTTHSTVGVGIVAALALLGAVVFAPVLRVSGLPAPTPALHTQLTSVGNVQIAEIAPNGEFLALVTDSTVLVQDLQGGTTLRLAARDPAAESRVTTVRWSPDGSEFLVVERDSTFLETAVAYPRLGGAPRTLPVRGYAAWSPDGTRIAWWHDDSPIHLLDLTTGVLDSVPLPTPDAIGYRQEGDWSPDGRFIAFSSVSPDATPRYTLWTVAEDGSQLHCVVDAAVAVRSPRWAENGRALYYLHEAESGSEVRKIGLDAKGRARRVPRVLQRGLAAPGQLSVSTDGATLVLTRVQRWSDLWLAVGDRGQRPVPFADRRRVGSASAERWVEASPGGAWLAYADDGDGGAEIVVVATGDDAPPRRIAVGGRLRSAQVAWSPDGRALAVLTDVFDTARVRIVDLDGAVRTLAHADVGTELRWAPGPRLLVQGAGGRGFHLVDPEDGSAHPLVTNDSLGWMSHAAVAPDGRTVAVHWNRSGRAGVWVVSPHDGSQSLVLSGAAYRPVGWSHGGDLVYVLDRDTGTLLLVPSEGGLPAEIGTLPFPDAECTLRERGGTIALACTVPRNATDAWMIERFDPEAERRIGG